MRPLAILCVCLGLAGCASAHARRRVYIGAAAAVIAGTALTVTGIAVQSSDRCHGSCTTNMQVMWSGGATATFLGGAAAFMQYLMPKQLRPRPESYWNYVPQPQPKPRWPASSPPDPTGPPPPL